MKVKYFYSEFQLKLFINENINKSNLCNNISYIIHYISELSPSWACHKCCIALFSITNFTIVWMSVTATFLFTFGLKALNHIIQAWGTCWSKSYFLNAISKALAVTIRTRVSGKSITFVHFILHSLFSLIILAICASSTSLQVILIKI